MTTNQRVGGSSPSWVTIEIKTFIHLGKGFFVRKYFILYAREILICRVDYLPRDVNIIRDVKGYRNTACGHGDFCSVRLNGPVREGILTH